MYLSVVVIAFAPFLCFTTLILELEKLEKIVGMN